LNPAAPQQRGCRFPACDAKYASNKLHVPLVNPVLILSREAGPATEAKISFLSQGGDPASWTELRELDGSKYFTKTARL